LESLVNHPLGQRPSAHGDRDALHGSAPTPAICQVRLAASQIVGDAVSEEQRCRSVDVFRNSIPVPLATKGVSAAGTLN
jgi:hypothetical protein